MARTSIHILATHPLLALLVLLPSSALAADWADQALPIKKHDFGTVAVAAKTEFRFPIKNPLDRDLRIRTVRASCGCTTAIVETSVIEPGGTGAILARFNTHSFKGKRGATLTVVFDKPYYREAQLRVDGYIRSDMVFYPGAVEFGTVNQGDAVSKASKLMYAGRNDWKVVDVTSNQPWLMSKCVQTLRGNGRVDYEISVDLREDAPTGFFQDELVVLTNDRSMPRVPLRVTGSVESALTISPQAIALGSLKPGETVRQKLIVRGREPFLIDCLTCEGWEVDLAPTTVARTTHILFPSFTPTEKATGPQKVVVEIKTAGEESVTAKALLTAEVREN
jgi:hypothetical protein